MNKPDQELILVCSCLQTLQPRMESSITLLHATGILRLKPARLLLLSHGMIGDVQSGLHQSLPCFKLRLVPAVIRSLYT